MQTHLTDFFVKIVESIRTAPLTKKIRYFANYSVLILAFLAMGVIIKEIIFTIKRWYKKDKSQICFFIAFILFWFLILSKFFLSEIITQGHQLQSISYLSQSYAILHKIPAMDIHFDHGIFPGALTTIFYFFTHDYFKSATIVMFLLHFLFWLLVFDYFYKINHLLHYKNKFSPRLRKILYFSFLILIFLFITTFDFIKKMLFFSSVWINMTLTFLFLKLHIEKKETESLILLFAMMNTRFTMFVFGIILFEYLINIIKNKQRNLIVFLFLLLLNLHLFTDPFFSTLSYDKQIWNIKNFLNGVNSIFNIPYWSIIVYSTFILLLILLLFFAEKSRAFLLTTLALYTIIPFHYHLPSKYYHLTIFNVVIILLLKLFYDEIISYIIQHKGNKTRSYSIKLGLEILVFIITLLMLISHSIFWKENAWEIKDWWKREKESFIKITNLIEKMKKENISEIKYVQLKINNSHFPSQIYIYRVSYNNYYLRLKGFNVTPEFINYGDLSNLSSSNLIKSKNTAYFFPKRVITGNQLLLQESTYLINNLINKIKEQNYKIYEFYDFYIIIP